MALPEKLIVESTADGFGGNNGFYQTWKRMCLDRRGQFEQEYPVLLGVDLAKPGVDRTVKWSRVGDLVSWSETPDTGSATFPDEPPEQKRNEHIWDMIVLAAKSSRYGE